MRTTAKHRKGENADREMLFGLMPLYILHRASIEPVFSSAIVEQLHRHGLRLSVRSISQVLAALRRKGYLVLAPVPTGSHSQRVYRATRRGHIAIRHATERLQALYLKDATAASERS